MKVKQHEARMEELKRSEKTHREIGEKVGSDKSTGRKIL